MASRKKRGISMDGILWQQAESQRLLTHVDEEGISTNHMLILFETRC